MEAKGKRFLLDEIDVPMAYLSDVLRCLMHTLVFCRGLGPVSPTDGVVPLTDVVYAKILDATVDRAVEERVATVVQDTLRHRERRKCQAVLTFFNPVSRAGVFWTTTSKEPFEHWAIQIKLTTPVPQDSSQPIPNPSSVPQQQRDELASSLRLMIGHILAVVSDHRDHIPSSKINAFSERERMPFPFEISLPEERSSIFSAVMGMIRSPHTL